MMSSTEKLEKLLAAIEIDEVTGNITINGDLTIRGKLETPSFISPSLKSEDMHVILKDMPASLDKTVEVKEIKQFHLDYPGSVSLLTAYPNATHYGVDGRGDLVLYKNNKPLVFIKSVNPE